MNFAPLGKLAVRRPDQRAKPPPAAVEIADDQQARAANVANNSGKSPVRSRAFDHRGELMTRIDLALNHAHFAARFNRNSTYG